MVRTAPQMLGALQVEANTQLEAVGHIDRREEGGVGDEKHVHRRLRFVDPGQLTRYNRSGHARGAEKGLQPSADIKAILTAYLCAKEEFVVEREEKIAQGILR